jgi:hypothetical protein
MLYRPSVAAVVVAAWAERLHHSRDTRTFVEVVALDLFLSPLVREVVRDDTDPLPDARREQVRCQH